MGDKFDEIAERLLRGKQAYMGGLPYTRQLGEIISPALRNAAAEAVSTNNSKQGE